MRQSVLRRTSLFRRFLKLLHPLVQLPLRSNAQTSGCEAAADVSSAFERCDVIVACEDVVAWLQGVVGCTVEGLHCVETRLSFVFFIFV